MDSSSLDLSKIVSLIMENPQLINDIKSLAENSEKKAEINENNEDVYENNVKEAYQIVEENRVAEVSSLADTVHSNRKKLLSAFKPYLSGERKRALDSIVTITEILDAMKAR